MRTYKELTPEQRTRFTSYIRMNRDVPSTELGEDLNLRPTTVAAVKANADRELSSRFNNLLR